jgi:ABC-type transport system substrate-binding protein
MRGFLRRLALAVPTWRPSLLAAALVVLLIFGVLLIGSGLSGKHPGPEQAATTATTADDLLGGVPAKALARLSVVKVGVDDAMSIINPLYSSGDGEIASANLIFEPLVRVDENSQPAAVLAEAWQYDAATHRLIFTLRRDHTFADGRVVAPSDVRFTYQCLLDPSYDGPWRGRIDQIVSVAADEESATVNFTLADWVQQPDYRMFTAGILKADYYQCPPGKVFEIRNANQPPQGSGPFALASQDALEVVLRLRPGYYGGSITEIDLKQIASQDKYQMLLDGDLDIVRNLWDARMQSREDTLPGYSFMVFESSVDSYFLTNASPQPSSIIQSPEQRLAVLLAAAGRPLAEEQKATLAPLSQAGLVIYYFSGLEDAVLQDNQEKARQIASKLQSAGLTVTLQGLGWPDLVERAIAGSYDLMLLPATANGRLPDHAVILDDQVRPDSSVWIAGYRSEVFIVSNRLAQLDVNPHGNPFAALPANWTDRIENVRIYDANGSIWEAAPSS